jgi:uncharacterized protein YndB with AHSA1/START domain
MATPQVTPDTTLRIERRLSAPPAKVFEAWTKAEALSAWFAPSPDFTVKVHELEPRLGGRYKIDMRSPDGASHIAWGTYREFSPPTRLAFTWQWQWAEPEDTRKQGETLVTIDFDADGAGTRLVLTHERFPDAAAREGHTKGWTGCLDQLSSYLGR